MTVTWDEIVATDEYQQDLSDLLDLSVNAVGNESLMDSSDNLLYAQAHLNAILRYKIRHLVDVVDIDATDFLDTLKKEVGLDLPVLDQITLLELIRENKQWFGHKGTEVLYDFAGALVGSPVKINYPQDLIFTLSGSRSCLSGAAGAGGKELPFEQSKLARIRDGIYWAHYTYVVSFLQAQNIHNFTDALAVMDNVHPAGTKRYLKAFYNLIPDSFPQTATEFFLGISQFFESRTSWPTLDNRWMLSTKSAPLSMHGHYGYQLLQVTNIVEIPLLAADSLYRRISDSECFNKQILDSARPWISFQRDIYQPDGTWTTVYSDNDALVYENVTTNVGVQGYNYGLLKNLSYRDLKDAAYNKDQQNMRGSFFNEVPVNTVIS